MTHPYVCEPMTNKCHRYFDTDIDYYFIMVLSVIAMLTLFATVTQFACGKLSHCRDKSSSLKDQLVNTS